MKKQYNFHVNYFRKEYSLTLLFDDIFIHDLISVYCHKLFHTVQCFSNKLFLVGNPRIEKIGTITNRVVREDKRLVLN